MSIAFVDGRAHELEPASVLAGVRRLVLLADSAEDAETVYGALARELMAVMGAEEVHVHHLTPPGEDEPVVVDECRVRRTPAAGPR